MENTVDSKQEGFRQRSKSRVMGKLFGKEKKSTTTTQGDDEENISAFLRGPSDTLLMTGASPPVLSKIDTSSARRWPTAAEVNRSRDPSRRRSASPKRSKKGHVRFTDEEPEIIGEGGDEAESPTLEISERKRSNSHPTVLQQYIHQKGPNRPAGSKDFLEGSTGHDSRFTPKRLTHTVQVEMRAAEGKALKGATSFQTNSNTASKLSSARNDPQSILIHPGSPSLAAVPSQWNRAKESIPSAAKTPAYSLHSTAVAAVDDAFRVFSDRVKHLSRLFELSANSTFPIAASSLEDLVAAASWWFLRGRMRIENTVKDRVKDRLESPQNRSNDILQRQGHTDLAKALWIVLDVIPRRPEIGAHHIDELNTLTEAVRSTGNEYLADVLDRCQAIHANLRKVAVSMRRHVCLPPPVEETPLPQGVDTTIWVAYPSFTPDTRALLTGQSSGPLSQTYVSPKKISDLMPLGDTREAFTYSRMWVDVFLMEERIDSEEFRCPCILSITRLQKEKGLTLMISSQTSLVALCIQSNKAYGFTWNDVAWQARINALELKLPRGFIVRAQCEPSDFKMLWSMYDYTSKVHASFQPRKNEEIVLEKIVKTFQYSDRDTQSRVFPKELVARCHVRIIEKKLSELEGSGTRSRHLGLRIAIITNSSTKNLSGITHDLPTRRPIQYDFMRDEEGAQALILSVNEGAGAKKSSMVFNFDDIHDRTDMHNCITGGPQMDETALPYIPIKHFSVTIASSLRIPRSENTLDAFEWQGIRVINSSAANNTESESQQVVLSEHLRVTIDSRTGSLADRISVGPGELRLRLSAQPLLNEISLLRQPQEDLTISVLESQVSTETPQELIELLGVIAKSQTIRKFGFSSIEDLHTFQTAITGFSILFDSIAESFAISRRRMVVPIYKKWEASAARIQILCQNRVVQLAGFFENFSHGECMNFILKRTDSFESFNRNGKFCIRIVDAKFSALKDDDADEDISKKFICLDMPDYPGEHDDITIAFDSETTRNKMAQVLPAPVKLVTRLGTVRK